jgi:hypothetical protein
MRMESTTDLTFRAMKKAAETDAEAAGRVDLYEHRTLRSSMISSRIRMG